MNTTQCPECLSTYVSGDAHDRLIDCLNCGLWWDPHAPACQPGSPFWGCALPHFFPSEEAGLRFGVEIVQAVMDGLARPDGAENSEVTAFLQWDWSSCLGGDDLYPQA